MQQAFSPEVEGTINSIVNSFYYRNELSRHVNNTKEDLLSEARLTALIAIRKFDESKKVKLHSYVGRCVKNRLKDLNKNAYCTKRASYIFCGDSTEAFSNIESDEDLTTIELEIDAASVLSPTEYKIFSMVVAGYNLTEIIKYFSQKNGTGRDSTRDMVRKCFSHIWQKLKLKETNPISTRSKSRRSYCVAMPY